MLFDFQEAIIDWAVGRERCAIFADCGLGKTIMQLEWLRRIGGRGLVVAPLAVAQQTRYEGRKFGLTVSYIRDAADIDGPGLYVTNYEMVDHFPAESIDAIVLDESSILKSIDGKTRGKLIEMYRDVRYRLCCTATPAPNDVTELGNHAEFLGQMTNAQMLGTFFVNRDGEWELKGHAVEAFYEWMATWCMMFTTPDQLGFPSNGYHLPPLNVDPVFVDVDHASYAQATGRLFVTGMAGVEGRLLARRMTMDERVKRAAEIIGASDEQWVVWCGLNDEGRQLHRSLDDSVLVEGADSLEDKIRDIGKFFDQSKRVLITKVRIGGFGLNLQHCHNMMFLGISDSYEQYYQAIRRCWRFGQESPVNVIILTSDIERVVLENVQNKEREHQLTVTAMAGRVADYDRLALNGQSAASQEYDLQEPIESADYRLIHGDCREQLAAMRPDSIDFTIFSPPFLDLFSYSADPRDLGNSRDDDEFGSMYQEVADGLLHVTKKGRLVAVHVAQVPAKLAHDGFIGLKDFRGLIIQIMTDAGFDYHGDVTIDKNPQAQAIRTHSKALLFKQLKKDASWLRPGLADFILVFRKPGESSIPIHPDITNEDWVTWAHPVWYGLRESDTLNKAEARTEKDEKHIAPLQLGVIERCIRLWSNPEDTVLSPFAGIGSEGYVALEHGRKFLGIELKPEYFKVAGKNLEKAIGERTQMVMPLVIS